MNVLLQIISALYGRLLWFYPRGFRSEFEQEMHMVFYDALVEAAEKGLLYLLRLCLRELQDWPGAAFKEHWHSLQERLRTDDALMSDDGHRIVIMPGQEKNPMTNVFGNGNRMMDDKRLALTAGLPPFLLGLGVALSSLLHGAQWQSMPSWRFYLSIAALLIPAAVVAGGGLFALFKKMPDWSLTWVGTGFIGFVLLLKGIADEQADVGKFLISQSGDSILTIVLFIIGLGLLGIVSLRGWRNAGLLSIGLSVTLGLSVCGYITAAPFNRHDLSLIALPVGLLLALLIYLYIRGSDMTRFAVLLGVAILNVGTVLMANQVWRDWLTSRNKPSPILPLLVLIMALLLSGPVMGAMVQPIRKALGRT
jgi:hypothetical protein